MTSASTVVSAASPADKGFEALFRAGIDALDAHFLVFRAQRDDQGEVIDLVLEYANAAAVTAAGIPEGRLLGHGLRELFPVHAGSGLLERYAATLDTQVPADIEIPWFEEGNLAASFDISAVPCGDRLVVVARDVTDRQRMVEALQSANAREQTVVAATPIIVFTLDREGHITTVEGKALTDAGVDGASLVGRSVYERYAGCPAVVGAVRQVLAGRPARFEVRSRGTVWDCDAVPMFDAEANIVGGLVVATNVTESRRTREALELSEKRFRSLVQDSLDIIVLLDEHGQFTYTNPAAERLLGPSSSEPAGHDLLAVVHPDDRAQVASLLDRMVASAATSSTATVQFRVAAANGEWRSVEAVANNCLDDPAVRGIIINAHDITERTNLIRSMMTLSRGNQALVHATDESQLLDSICEVIVQAGYPLAWVGWVKQDKLKTIERLAAAGRTGYLDGLKVGWGDNKWGGGPAGRAVRTGTTQVVGDLLTDGEFAPWCKRASSFGLRSCIVAPLQVQGEVQAILAIYASEPGVFDDGSSQILLAELAADAAYGLARLRDSQRLNRSLEATIESVGTIVELRDPYTAGHQRRVARLAAAIAREMDLGAETEKGIHVAGGIHDIGKVIVPSDILTRPGRLNPEEFGLVKLHPRAGYDIVAGVDFPWPIAETILQHHERLDGSGYPAGLKDNDILLAARIVAVSDTVEAMASHRPYRPALGFDAATEEIRRGRGWLFDPDVVDACIGVLSGAFTF